MDTTVPASGRLGLDDVSSNDGAAYTVILSEACGSTSVTTPLSWNTRAEVGWNIFHPIFGLDQDSQPPKVINSGALARPSSNHPGGAVMAFCDGHTEFAKDSLAASVYAQLLSWNDAGTQPPEPTAPNYGIYSGWTTIPGGRYGLLNEAHYK